MTARHRIVDHAFAALPLEGDAPAYAPDDLAALEAALAALAEPEERVEVHVQLVTWLGILFERGLDDAVDQLLPVLLRFADAPPELAAPDLGHDGRDRLDRGARPDALFGARPASAPLPDGPRLSLLALRARR